jgi:hypothetical protein
MTVQQLIDTLQTIEDKTREIRVMGSTGGFPDDIEFVRDTRSGIIIYVEPEY